MKLGAVRLVDTTAVNPEVVEAIPLGLISAKLNLSIARFTASYVFLQILESDFLVIRLPCMRKDGIAGNLLADESRQDETAVGVHVQKAH
jgi:hypothetical protein